MKKSILLAATALLWMGITSCNNEKTINIDGEWAVSTIEGESLPETINEVILSFDTNTQSYHGMTGVNIINGNYELKDNAITLSEGALTQMMGDSISMVVEAKYINAIHSAKSIAESEGQITLQDAEGNALMVLVKK